MNFRVLIFLSLLILTSCSTNVFELDDGRLMDYKSLVVEFENPGIDYRPAPLWVWNNEVSREDIDWSLTELKEQGIGGVFIHPRRGLITEYLSDEWFDLVAYSLVKAKELNMNIWLYDENVCPSGFAGGHVYNEMPESYNQGTSLINTRMEILDLSPSDDLRVKYVFQKINGEWQNISDICFDKEGETGDFMVYFLKNFRSGMPNYANFSYVDLIAKGVTEKFMDITMKGYERVGQQEFGGLIPGIFTDEPQIGSEGGLRYTPDLFDEFNKRWGYRLEDSLVGLTEESGNWKKLRHDYRSVLLEMFIERWSLPWYNYAEDNNLIWTGHYWENTWPDIYHGPDNMAMYAWHQMPGIDMLFNSLEHRPDQFGNSLAVKELSSIANQFERHRTLSESYGGAGWDLRFEDMKRLGDWQYALGVNFLNQHISQLSLVGYRKQNYPQSFLDYNPYWKLYKNQMDYFARLSVALSSGRQLNNILVMEPTTTIWMYYGGSGGQKIKEIGDSFKEIIQVLENQQVEYDIGCEKVIKDHGRIDGTNFIVNKRAYNLVIFPKSMENIDQESLDLLNEYVKSGGKVLQIGNSLQLVDGTLSKEPGVLSKYENWVRIEDLNPGIADELLSSDGFNMSPSVTGRVHHHRRQLNDGQILFLSNFSLDEQAATCVEIKGASVVELNPHTGAISPLSYKKNGNLLSFSINLGPGGSFMAFVHNNRVVPASGDPGFIKELLGTEASIVQKDYPNVLTIDYVDLKLRDEEQHEVYYADASDLIYQAFGYEDGNPWNAVQYKTIFLDQNKEHRDDDPFELSYNFNVADGVDFSDAKIVVEQASFYEIRFNGIAVYSSDETWLDPDFKCIEIEDYLKTGINTLSLSMNRFDNRCDPSPAYVLGNFSLQSLEKGWEIIKEKEIEIGSWKNQGYPFYCESVSYTKNIRIKYTGKYEVELPDWYGTVAELLVNNQSRGIIQAQPYTKDLYLEDGPNEITVIVYGSLKNAFGPHHVYARGFMRPPAFRKGKEVLPPGREYDFLDYGLFKDFEIYRIINQE